MARSESVTRVGITPEAAFEMWSDMIRLSEFLPGILEAKKAGDGVYSLVLRAGDRKETTRVAYSVIEHPRRIVWRSKGGAKWNGEVILRPVSEGTEVRFIVDYEPSASRTDVSEDVVNAPTWNVGADLLAFANYTERVQVEVGEEVEAVSA